MKAWLKYLSIAAYLTVAIFSLLPIQSLAKQETYRPPKGKVRQQARKAGGSRGCNLPINNTVILLVPQDHTATTISAHPTFFWYLSQKSSTPLRFTLLEPGKKPILTKELTPKSGIIALKLPQNSQGLKIGKTYRWTVTVVCNRKQPSSNLFAQAWIERVPLPTSHKFSEYTNQTSFCSTKYAQAGIWYDALACDYSKLLKNNNDPRDSQEFWSLLEEIDLPYLAQRKPTLSLY
jgi:hypothetical protein